LVGEEGIEPSLPQRKLDFKSSVSTVPPLARVVIMAHPAGIEPATFALEGHCSIR
jgi:hypothetical protein